MIQTLTAMTIIELKLGSNPNFLEISKSIKTTISVVSIAIELTRAWKL